MGSSDSRPFYGTVWFNVLATAMAVAAVILAAVSMPSLEGRPTAGIGQFGVVLVALYWVLVFPKLRKIRRPGNRAQSGPNPPRPEA